MLLPHFHEQVDVAFAAMAKAPGVAHGDAAQRTRRADELLDEISRRCFGGLGGERAGQQAVDAGLGEDELLMARAAEQFRGGGGAQHLYRMRVEGHNDRRSMMLRGVLLCSTNDFLVPQVDPIKHTHG